jgi:hypothetical protein
MVSLMGFFSRQLSHSSACDQWISVVSDILLFVLWGMTVGDDGSGAVPGEQWGITDYTYYTHQVSFLVALISSSGATPCRP